MTTYKKFSFKSMKEAAKRVEDIGSIKKAAMEAGIPEGTLRYFMKNQHTEKNDHKSRHREILTTDEDNELNLYVIDSLNNCAPLTRMDIKIKAAEIRNRRIEDDSTPHFTRNFPSDKWINSFLARHNFVSRLSERLNEGCLLVTKRQVEKFYEKTTQYFRNMPNNLDNNSNIYFSDANQINFEPFPKRVIAPTGSKILYDKTKNDEKLCASIGYVIRASGSLLTPQIIFNKATQNKAELENFCIEHNFILGVSGNAVQTKKTFQEYFKHLVQILEKPALVFLDGNSAYCDQVFVGWCREKDVFSKFLPPNSTPILNPVHNSIFDGIKNSYSQKAYEFKLKNQDKKLTAFDFVQLLSEVNTCIEGALIQKSFEKAGIWPFDINKNIDRFIDDHGEQTIQKVNTRRFSQIEENEETACCSTHQNKIVKITESDQNLIRNEKKRKIEKLVKLMKEANQIIKVELVCLEPEDVCEYSKNIESDLKKIGESLM